SLLQRGHHGSTFGGNPLATAVAGAVLTEIESAGLVANAARQGEAIRRLVRSLNSPHIAEVRGRGLLIGIGLAQSRAKELATAALERGLIINAPNDHSIRLAPPLIIGDTEVGEFGALFGEALAALDSEAQA